MNMRHPTEYKTKRGLYKATARALQKLDGCKRGFYLLNAIFHAEENLKDPAFAQQLRDLNKFNLTIDDLEIIRI